MIYTIRPAYKMQIYRGHEQC